MAVVFISHSSADDACATSLEAWLTANGITDVFIDHENISAGEKWRDALRQSAASCRVVICLITVDWLRSSECFNEFMAAWYMGRRIIPMILIGAPRELQGEEQSRFSRVCGEDQGISLAHCISADRTLAIEQDPSAARSLRGGLLAAGANSRIGLDPEAFAIDRKIREIPFPGLASFGDEDADAALFYGRSREISHVLEDLRSMRALNDRRLLVIQGSSGAGKSSLLKAGVIPRLRREQPAWLPLRVFRPGADPLLNFAEAITKTLADFGHRDAPGIVRDRLRAAWEREQSRADLGAETRSPLSEAMEHEGTLLRNASGRPAPRY